LLGDYYGGCIYRKPETECRTSTTILTSRGCKYKCAFCSSGLEVFNGDYKIERIEKEIEHCLSLGIKDMRISDDNLVSDRKRLIQLCDIFRENNIRWRGSIRVMPSDLGLYKYMRESGCQELSFGIESGDQDVLDLLNKNVTVWSNIKAIQRANKAGIPVTCALLMMGTPGETEDTLKKNIKWVEEAKPKLVSLKMFVPYPGTDIYNRPEYYKCSIDINDLNNSAYRPDKSEPRANIVIDGIDLNKQFQIMKKYLESKGLANYG
jgi:radical SAM superfamily enzyme YgiQ (UPF0313 family)